MASKLLSIGLLYLSLGGWCSGDAWADGHAGIARGDREAAGELLAASGVRGGLVVHLGCGEGRLTAALRANDSYVVQGLDTDAKKIDAARRYVQSLGLAGKVSFDRVSGPQLPYIDNLVNLLVVEQPGAGSKEEMMRVLAPNGVACLREEGQWKKIVKPRPRELDEWNQYLHDASNNAVAHDSVIGPPRHLQWIADPDWSRHHDHMASLSALVSAAGRIFYIVDEGPREAILLPARWSLVARDAFSGALLWKRPIAEWNTHLWPLKSGPNQLPRRLVAVGDRVYVTLGIDAALSALDAATGKTLLEFHETEHTDEAIISDGTLFLLVGQSANKWKDYRPNATYVWANTQRANRDWAWDQQKRWVMAADAESGKILWKTEHTVAPLTLAADAEHVYFYNGEQVECLDRASGRPLWISEAVVRKSAFPTGYGPTLVVQQGVVLLSVENRSMTAISAEDGKTLWSGKHNRGGHMSPDDMLVINGLVWSGAVASGADSGVFTGRDIRTGEVKSEFLPDVQPDWFHHRCYRSRATDKYFLASRTGIELIDVEGQHWDINHWVRGGCLYGFMPSDGMLFMPPHSCGCFLESKLFGFTALAAERKGEDGKGKAEETTRLEKGPAYDDSDFSRADSNPQDWPTYRHDAARSGSVRTSVPAEGLKRAWQIDLDGKLSSVVVAGGRLYVAAVDRHTVYALDAGSGQTVWSYTVGGRVDSPPTIYRGRVLFGSADGSVYCLRADDGRLVWRYLAAPVDRRLMAYDQVESAWPVSGSVLVEKGAVYCVAGRSAFLDGGMRLLILDPKTGRKISDTVIDDRDPETGEGLQMHIQGQDMPVALPDILSSDGQSVYMRSQAFDMDGVRRNIAPLKLGRGKARRRGEKEEEETQPEIRPHLFSRSGFLDDSWFFRSYWLFGTEVASNYGGWLLPGHMAPSGRLMVFDDENLYGFGRKPQYLCNASAQEYYLYKADRDVNEEAVERVLAATGRINASSPNRSSSSSDWAIREKFSLSEQSVANYRWALGNPPIQARALVLAGDTLFVAGPPDVVDEEEALRNPDDPAIKARLEAQTDALAGRMGGQLLAVSAADGTLVAAYDIGAMPTFDGMAAAGGKLFLTTVDGKVMCLGPKGESLEKTPGTDLVPLDIAVKETPRLGAKPPGPPANDAFTKVVGAEVTRCDLGFQVFGTGKKMGLAVNKLEKPIEGKAHFKVRMKVAPQSDLQNGFLVFGSAAKDAELVKCGLRFIMGKAVIVEGPMTGGQTAQAAFESAGGDKIHEVEVDVDLATGEVVMKVGAATVQMKLKGPPTRITHLGYGVLNATTQFSEIEK